MKVNVPVNWSSHSLRLKVKCTKFVNAIVYVNHMIDCWFLQILANIFLEELVSVSLLAIAFIKAAVTDLNGISYINHLPLYSVASTKRLFCYYA